jgi:NAD-dependent deacetylase
VHGSIDTSSCGRCGASYELPAVEALFDEQGVARCAACGGAVKPDVVLFGELLPEAAIREAEGLAVEAELLLCIGTSLEVHPVAGLPRLTLEAGGRLAIVTRGPTPYDELAALRLRGEVDEELAAVLAGLS